MKSMMLMKAAMKLSRWAIAHFKKLTAVVTVSCFIVTGVCGQAISALSQETQDTSSYKQAAENLLIPASIGRVTNAGYHGSDTVVITISNLHCHAEVQKNINSILVSLDEKYPLSRVYLEGAAGKIDAAWLKTIEPKMRAKLLESLIGKGQLTGAEYFAVNTNKNTEFLGLENDKIYRENSLRLGKITDNQNEVNALVEQMGAKLETVKNEYYNPSQKNLEKLVKKHRDGKLNSVKYYHALKKYAEGLNIDVNGYRNLARFEKLLGGERDLNYRRISAQMSELLSVLKNRLPYAAYQSVIAQATKDPQHLEGLYRILARMVHTYNIDISSEFPELNRFFAYIRDNQEINPVSLIRDENRLLAEINLALASNEGERDVAFLLDFFRHFSDYFNNKISAEDYEYFSKNLDEFKLQYEAYTNDRSLAKLDPYFDTLNVYYKTNLERNQWFIRNMFGETAKAQAGHAVKPLALFDNIENAISDLPKAKEIVVTVTGGFHTPGLEKLLDENGITYISLTPNVTEEAKYAEAVYWEKIYEQNVIFSQAFADYPILGDATPLDTRIATLVTGVLLDNSLKHQKEAAISTLLAQAKKIVGDRQMSVKFTGKNEVGNLTYTVTVDNKDYRYEFTDAGVSRRTDVIRDVQEPREQGAIKTVLTANGWKTIVSKVLRWLKAPASLAYDKTLKTWARKYFVKKTLWDEEKARIMGNAVSIAVDYNVSRDKQTGRILDSERIEESLASINYVLHDLDAGEVRLMAHAERPQEQIEKIAKQEGISREAAKALVEADKLNSLSAAADWLTDYFAKTDKNVVVLFDHAWRFPDQAKARVDEEQAKGKKVVLLLENTRFDEREEAFGNADKKLKEKEKTLNDLKEKNKKKKSLSEDETKTLNEAQQAYDEAKAIADNEYKGFVDMSRRLFSGSVLAVLDAGSKSHRAHVSVIGAPAAGLELVAGFSFVNEFWKTMKTKAKVVLNISGGGKPEEKVELLKTIDGSLVGGMTFNTFLKVRGFAIGKTDAGSDKAFSKVKKINDDPKIMKNVTLPDDAVIMRVPETMQGMAPRDILKAVQKQEKSVVNAAYYAVNIDYTNKKFIAANYEERQIVEKMLADQNFIIVDIGPQTAQMYADRIDDLVPGQTVFISGVPGIADILWGARNGSAQIFKALERAAERGVVTSAGGGDTLSIAKMFGAFKAIVIKLLGGGASTELLSGKTWPGFEALTEKQTAGENLIEATELLRKALPGATIMPPASTFAVDTSVNGNDKEREARLDVRKVGDGWLVETPMAMKADQALTDYNYAAVSLHIAKDALPKAVRENIEAAQSKGEKVDEKKITEHMQNYLKDKFGDMTVLKAQTDSSKLKKDETGYIAFDMPSLIAVLDDSGDVILQTHFWVKGNNLAAFTEWYENIAGSLPKDEFIDNKGWALDAKKKIGNGKKALDFLSRNGWHFFAEFRKKDYANADLLTDIIQKSDPRDILDPMLKDNPKDPNDKNIVLGKSGRFESLKDMDAKVPGYGKNLEAFLAGLNEVEQLSHYLYLLAVPEYDKANQKGIALNDQKLQNALIDYYFRTYKYFDYVAVSKFNDIRVFETMRMGIARHAEKLHKAIAAPDAVNVNTANYETIVAHLTAKGVALTDVEKSALEKTMELYTEQGALKPWAFDVLQLSEIFGKEHFRQAFRHVTVGNGVEVLPSEKPNEVTDGAGRIGSMGITLRLVADLKAKEEGYIPQIAIRTRAVDGKTDAEKFAGAAKAADKTLRDEIIENTNLEIPTKDGSMANVAKLVKEGRITFEQGAAEPLSAKMDFMVTKEVKSVYPVSMKLDGETIATLYYMDMGQFNAGIADAVKEALGKAPDNTPRPMIVVDEKGNEIVFNLVTDATPGSVDMGDGDIETMSEAEKTEAKLKFARPTLWEMVGFFKLNGIADGVIKRVMDDKTEVARLNEISDQVKNQRLGEGKLLLYLKSQITTFLLPLGGGVHFLGRYIHKLPFVPDSGVMFFTPTSCSTNGATHVTKFMSMLFGFGHNGMKLSEAGTTWHGYTEKDGGSNPGKIIAKTTGAAKGVKQHITANALYTAARVLTMIRGGKAVIAGGSMFSFIIETPFDIPEDVVADFLEREGAEESDVIHMFNDADKTADGRYTWKDTISGQKTGSIVYKDTIRRAVSKVFTMMVGYDNEASYSTKMQETKEAFFRAMRRQKERVKRFMALNEAKGQIVESSLPAKNTSLDDVEKLVAEHKAVIAGLGATNFNKEDMPEGWTTGFLHRLAGIQPVLFTGSRRVENKSNLFVKNVGEPSVFVDALNVEAAMKSDIIVPGVPEAALIPLMMQIRRELLKQGLSGKVFLINGVPMFVDKDIAGTAKKGKDVHVNTYKTPADYLETITDAEGKVIVEGYFDTYIKELKKEGKLSADEIAAEEALVKQIIQKAKDEKVQSMGEIIDILLQGTGNKVVIGANNIPAFQLKNWEKPLPKQKVQLFTRNPQAGRIAAALLKQMDKNLEPEIITDLKDTWKMESKTAWFAQYFDLTKLTPEEFETVRPEVEAIHKSRLERMAKLDLNTPKGMEEGGRIFQETMDAIATLAALAKVKTKVDKGEAVIAGLGGTNFDKKTGQPKGWAAGMLQRLAGKQRLIAGSRSDKSSGAKDNILGNTSGVNPDTISESENIAAALKGDIVAIGVPEAGMIGTAMKVRKAFLDNKVRGKIVWVFGVPMDVKEDTAGTAAKGKPVHINTYKMPAEYMYGYFSEYLKEMTALAQEGKLSAEELKAESIAVTDILKKAKEANVQSMGEIIDLIMEGTGNTVVNAGNNIPAFQLGNTKKALPSYTVDVMTGNKFAGEIVGQVIRQMDGHLKTDVKDMKDSVIMERRTAMYAQYFKLLDLTLEQFDANYDKIIAIHNKRIAGELGFNEAMDAIANLVKEAKEGKVQGDQNNDNNAFGKTALALVVGAGIVLAGIGALYTFFGASLLPVVPGLSVLNSLTGTGTFLAGLATSAMVGLAVPASTVKKVLNGLTKMLISQQPEKEQKRLTALFELGYLERDDKDDVVPTSQLARKYMDSMAAIDMNTMVGKARIALENDAANYYIKIKKIGDGDIVVDGIVIVPDITNNPILVYSSQKGKFDGVDLTAEFVTPVKEAMDTAKHERLILSFAHGETGGKSNDVIGGNKEATLYQAEELNVASLKKEYKGEYKLINDVLVKFGIDTANYAAVTPQQLVDVANYLIVNYDLTAAFNANKGSGEIATATVAPEIVAKNKEKLTELYPGTFGMPHVRIVGGKASSLARMHKAGIPVPYGYNTTVMFFRTILDANPVLKKYIQDSLAKLDVKYDADREEVANYIREYFMSDELVVPEEVWAAYDWYYITLSLREGKKATDEDGLRIAVRSSGTSEDVARAADFLNITSGSEAGQGETRLNIRGLKALHAAFLGDAAALFTSQAINYRDTQVFISWAVELGKSESLSIMQIFKDLDAKTPKDPAARTELNKKVPFFDEVLKTFAVEKKSPGTMRLQQALEGLSNIMPDKAEKMKGWIAELQKQRKEFTDPEKIGIGIVNMKMANSYLAGVAFTLNSVTGFTGDSYFKSLEKMFQDRGFPKARIMKIDASFKLGESVVSNLTIPDSYLVLTLDGVHWQVIDKTLGAKENMSVYLDDAINRLKGKMSEGKIKKLTEIVRPAITMVPKPFNEKKVRENIEKKLKEEDASMPEAKFNELLQTRMRQAAADYEREKNEGIAKANAMISKAAAEGKFTELGLDANEAVALFEIMKTVKARRDHTSVTNAQKVYKKLGMNSDELFDLSNVVISITDDSFTTLVKTPKNMRDTFTLDGEILQKLATMLHDISELYGDLRDIEWAVEVAENGEQTIQVEQAYDLQGNAISIKGMNERAIQARPYTAKTDRTSPNSVRIDNRVVSEKYITDHNIQPIMKGVPVIGAAKGRVKWIKADENLAAQFATLTDGDIMMVEFATPDYDPGMERAAGVLSKQGGNTSHVAIFCRENGIPAVVGIGEIPQDVLEKYFQDGMMITIDGNNGAVYAGGDIPLENEDVRIEVNMLPTDIEGKTGLIQASTFAAQKVAALTNYLKHYGNSLDRIEFDVVAMGVYPPAGWARDMYYKVKADPAAAKGLSKYEKAIYEILAEEHAEIQGKRAAAAAAGKPFFEKSVIEKIDGLIAGYPSFEEYAKKKTKYAASIMAMSMNAKQWNLRRLFDNKPNESRQLAGAELIYSRLVEKMAPDYKGNKEYFTIGRNPLISMRGQSMLNRYSKYFNVLLRGDLESIKGDFPGEEGYGFKNNGVMFVFVRTAKEVEEARKNLYSLVNEMGAESRPKAVGVMIETPAAAIEIDSILDVLESIKSKYPDTYVYLSFGTNDLTNLLGKTDRDAPAVQKLNIQDRVAQIALGLDPANPEFKNVSEGSPLVISHIKHVVARAEKRARKKGIVIGRGLCGQAIVEAIERGDYETAMTIIGSLDSNGVDIKNYVSSVMIRYDATMSKRELKNARRVLNNKKNLAGALKDQKQKQGVATEQVVFIDKDEDLLKISGRKDGNYIAVIRQPVSSEQKLKDKGIDLHNLIYARGIFVADGLNAADMDIFQDKRIAPRFKGSINFSLLKENGNDLKDGDLITIDYNSGTVLKGKFATKNVKRQLEEIKIPSLLKTWGVEKFRSAMTIKSGDIQKEINFHPLALQAYDDGQLDDLIAAKVKTKEMTLQDGEALKAAIRQFIDKESADKGAKLNALGAYENAYQRLMKAKLPKEGKKLNGSIVFQTASLASDEYAQLQGGKLIEVINENPSYGLVGVARLLTDMHRINRIELNAFKEVRNADKRLALQVTDLRGTFNGKLLAAYIAIMKDAGLEPGKDGLQVGVNIASEADVYMMYSDEYAKTGIQFATIDPALASGLLAVDLDYAGGKIVDDEDLVNILKKPIRIVKASAKKNNLLLNADALQVKATSRFAPVLAAASIVLGVFSDNKGEGNSDENIIVNSSRKIVNNLAPVFEVVRDLVEASVKAADSLIGAKEPIALNEVPENIRKIYDDPYIKVTGKEADYKTLTDEILKNPDNKMIDGNKIMVKLTSDAGQVAPGTSGDRGENGVKFNADYVLRLAQGIVEYRNNPTMKSDNANAAAIQSAMAEHRFDGNRKVVIAYDNRLLSQEYARLIASVLVANGIRVALSEIPMGTPVAAFAAASDDDVMLAVNITASHNAYTDIGVKLHPYHGGASPSKDMDIYKEKAKAVKTATFMSWDEVKNAKIKGTEDPLLTEINYADKYVDYLIGQLPKGAKEKIQKYWSDQNRGIIVNYMNGASIPYLEKLMTRLGLKENSDFVNINKFIDRTFKLVNGRPNPDSLSGYDEKIAAAFRKGKQLFEFAPDGDADRGADRDITGEKMQAGQMIPLIFWFMYNLKDENGNYLFRDGSGIGKTLVTSDLANAVANMLGVPIEEVATGFKNFVGLFESGKLTAAGEESSHIGAKLFDKSWDDGMVVGLMGMWIIAETGKSLTENLKEMEMAVKAHYEYGRVDLKPAKDEMSRIENQVLNLKLAAAILEENKKAGNGITLKYTDYLKKYAGTDKELPLIKVLEAIAAENGGIDRIIFSDKGKVTPEVDGYKIVFGNGNWIAVRISGTDGSVRVYGEIVAPLNAGDNWDQVRTDSFPLLQKLLSDTQDAMEIKSQDRLTLPAPYYAQKVTETKAAVKEERNVQQVPAAQPVAAETTVDAAVRQLPEAIVPENGKPVRELTQRVVSSVVSDELKDTGFYGGTALSVIEKPTDAIRKELGRKADLGMNAVAIANLPKNSNRDDLYLVSNVVIPIGDRKGVYAVWAEQVKSPNGNTALILYIEDYNNMIGKIAGEAATPEMLQLLRMKLLGIGALVVARKMNQDNRFRRHLRDNGLPFADIDVRTLTVQGKYGVFAFPELTNYGKGEDTLSTIAVGYRPDEDSAPSLISRDQLKMLGIDENKITDAGLDIEAFAQLKADVNIPSVAERAEALAGMFPTFAAEQLRKGMSAELALVRDEIKLYEGAYREKKKDAAMAGLKSRVSMLARVSELVPRPYDETRDFERGTVSDIKDYIDAVGSDGIGIDSLQFVDVLEPGSDYKLNTANIDPTLVPEIDQARWRDAIDEGVIAGNFDIKAVEDKLSEALSKGYNAFMAGRNTTYRQRYIRFQAFKKHAPAELGKDDRELYAQWLMWTQWQQVLRYANEKKMPVLFGIESDNTAAIKRFLQIGFAGPRIDLKVSRRVVPTDEKITALRAAIPDAFVNVVPPNPEVTGVSGYALDSLKKAVLKNNMTYVQQVSLSADPSLYSKEENVAIEMIDDGNQFTDFSDFNAKMEKLINSDASQVILIGSVLSGLVASNEGFRDRLSSEITIASQGTIMRALRFWTRARRGDKSKSIAIVRERAFVKGKLSVPQFSEDGLAKIREGLKKEYSFGKAESHGLYIIPAVFQSLSAQGKAGTDRLTELVNDNWFFKEFAEVMNEPTFRSYSKTLSADDLNKLEKALSYVAGLEKDATAAGDISEKMKYNEQLKEFITGFMTGLVAQWSPAPIDITEPKQKDEYNRMAMMADSLVGKRYGATVILTGENDNKNTDAVIQLMSLHGTLLNAGRFDEAKEVLATIAKNINNGAIKSEVAWLLFIEAVYDTYSRSKDKDISFIFATDSKGVSIIEAMRKYLSNYNGSKKSMKIGRTMLYRNAFSVIRDLQKLHDSSISDGFMEEGLQASTSEMSARLRNLLAYDYLAQSVRNAGKIETVEDFIDQYPFYAATLSHNKGVISAEMREEMLKVMEKEQLATPFGIRGNKGGKVFPMLIGSYIDLKGMVLADQGKTPRFVQVAVNNLMRPLIAWMSKDDRSMGVLPKGASFEITDYMPATESVSELLYVNDVYGDQKLPDFRRNMERTYKVISNDRTIKALLGAA